MKNSVEKDDLSALSDVLNLDMNDDFEYEDILNTAEEVIFEDIDTDEKKLKFKKIKESIDTRDYLSILEPHWLLDKNEVIKYLNVISGVISKSGDMLNKSLQVKQVDSNIIFSFNSNDIHGQFTISLENNINTGIIGKSFILDYSKFVVGVKNSESKVVLKDKPDSGTLTVDLLGGSIELENYLGLKEDSFNYLSKIDFSTLKIHNVDHNLLSNVLKNASATDKLSMRPEDRKVRFQDGQGFSYYSIMVINHKQVSIPEDFSLRLIDIVFLNKFMTFFNGNFTFTQNASNIFFINDTFKIGFPQVNTDPLKYIKRVSDNLVLRSEFTLETHQFYKKLNVIRQMIGNTNSVHLFTKDNNLWITGKNSNQRDTEFIVATNLDDSIKVDVRLPVMTLINTYKVFQSYENIKVITTDQQRFIFDVDLFRIIFGALI